MSDQAQTLRSMVLNERFRILSPVTTFLRDQEELSQAIVVENIAYCLSKEIGKISLLRNKRLRDELDYSELSYVDLESGSISSTEIDRSRMCILDHQFQSDLSPLKCIDRLNGFIGFIDNSDENLALLVDRLSEIRQKYGASNVGVIAHGVSDGYEGIQYFKEASLEINRSIGIQTEYLGHVTRDKRLERSHEKQDFLINLYSETPIQACLELILKRMRSRILRLDSELGVSRLIGDRVV